MHVRTNSALFCSAFQRYEEVPATPLVSVQVLQDEKETWGDMQVGGAGGWGRWVGQREIFETVDSFCCAVPSSVT